MISRRDYFLVFCVKSVHSWTLARHDLWLTLASFYVLQSNIFVCEKQIRYLLSLADAFRSQETKTGPGANNLKPGVYVSARFGDHFSRHLKVMETK